GLRSGVGCDTGSTVVAMKINRHGGAKVLTQQEIQLIFSHGLENDRDRSDGLRSPTSQRSRGSFCS
ncbi:MAG: hypothetical protein ACYT04_59485, partial [Nostoc sp.]